MALLFHNHIHEGLRIEGDEPQGYRGNSVTGYPATELAAWDTRVVT
jgi:hypothetical protein